MNNPELDKVLEVSPPTSRPDSPTGTKNVVANLLQIVGVVTLIVGMIAGPLIGVGSGYRTNWAVGVPIILSSAISCLVFFGFAEIIRLLETIAQNTLKSPNA